MSRASVVVAAAILSLFLAACGGGGGGSIVTSVGTTSTSSVNNVQPVVVDYGPTGQLGNAPPNILYTTIILCTPGTTTCQSIDHVQIDTGATGLRIISSAIALNLPFTTDANNNPIGNCIQYADTSYQWGPLAKADVKMAGEVASSVPIQIVGPPIFRRRLRLQRRRLSGADPVRIGRQRHHGSWCFPSGLRFKLRFRFGD